MSDALSGVRVPRVLVLMAVRNGARWIDEQLVSIAAQKGDLRLTVVACDDDSTDDTVARISRCKAALSLDVQLVQSARAGGSAGRNFFRLIESVVLDDFDFVALADQDDVWHPEKLQRALECLSRSGSAGYSASVEAFWPNGKVSLLTQSPHIRFADFLFEGAGQGCSFVLSAALMRTLQKNLRHHAESIGSIHYHDWALYALSRCHGAPWYFDAWPSMRYRQHAANDTGARAWGPAVFKRLSLIRSGWYALQVHRIAELCAAVGGQSAGAAIAFLALARGRASARQRIRMAAFAWRHGRRRRIDRLILVWACIAGHLAVDRR